MHLGDELQRHTDYEASYQKMKREGFVDSLLFFIVHTIQASHMMMESYGSRNNDKQKCITQIRHVGPHRALGRFRHKGGGQTESHSHHSCAVYGRLPPQCCRSCLQSAGLFLDQLVELGASSQRTSCECGQLSPGKANKIIASHLVSCGAIIEGHSRQHRHCPGLGDLQQHNRMFGCL